MRLAAVAFALHLGLDQAGRLAEWLAPPDALLRHAPEVFRTLSPLATGIAASAVHGVMAVILLAAVDPAGGPGRRARLLGLVLTGFWLLSEGLLALLWLSGPAAVVLASVATGIPRSFLVAWVLARLDARGGLIRRRRGGVAPGPGFG